MQPSLSDFDTPDLPDLSDAVDEICAFAQALTPAQVQRLSVVLQQLGGADQVYGADFDFSEEIAEQLKAVRALRRQVLDPAGHVKEGTSARDVKEMISASSTLLSGLMKVHEKIQSFERQRKIEEALLDVLEEFELKDEFMRQLEERLP